MIAVKVQCVQCLCETKRMTDSTKGRDITLFSCRAFARCSAPCGPIIFLERFSVVSVYVKENNERFDQNVGCYVVLL
jgi:hypothetical protein